MKQSTLIKIPLPLHAQFKALAAARNTTMTSLIADMVAKAIEAGEIPDATPGLELEITRDRTITLYGGTEQLAIMTPDQARDVAGTLEEVAHEGKVVAVVVESGLAIIRRRGTGVSIEQDAGGEQRHVMTPAIARNLARQIRKAADSVK